LGELLHFVFGAAGQAAWAAEVEFISVPCILRGVLRDPPEGEEDVDLGFQRGHFKYLSGEVFSVLEEEGSGILHPCSQYLLSLAVS